MTSAAKTTRLKMKNNPIKIAILGAGYMGQNHTRILSTLGKVNVEAICDKDIQKAEKVAKQYKIKSYTSYQTLLQNEQLNAISICLPTSLHYESATVAIEKGINLFIEKPICSTEEEAKKLINRAHIKKVAVMVGHVERFNPVINEIKQRIKSGELGKIFQIHTQRFSPPPSRAHDVSAIIDLATHDIDVIQYLLDEKPIRVYAETDNRAHRREDLMSAMMRFKNGVIGLIEVSWLHPTKIRNIRVLGENGMYVADYITQELLFYRQNENLFNNSLSQQLSITRSDVVKVAFQAKEPLQIELEAFIDALISGKKMPVTAQDGLLALEMAQKMLKSGQNHKIIK